MRQCLLAFALCFAAAAAAYPQIPGKDAPSLASDNAAREKPAVNVQATADAPLRISAETKWATSDQQMLEVYFIVKNIGRKPVRAYTVRVSHGTEMEEGDGCFLNSIERVGKILQPDHSAGRSTWRPVPLSGFQPAIDLALDFAEFTDGSTWGVDSCQSVERLSGLRAGARAAKLQFKRKLNEKGVDALLKDLYTDDPDLALPEGHSDAWKAGFRGAVSSLRERIRQANEEGGPPEIEAALQRPFDASENQ